jgi:hypothetical protein
MPLYWLLDYCTEDHADDFADSVSKGDVICIVDEDAGGIIAYALGEENAQKILAALGASK